MPNVRVALLGRAEEVEDRAIVPDVDGRHLPSSSHVGFNPVDRCRSDSEPSPRAGKGGGRYVQDRDARQSAIEKVIDEAGIPASHVDDSGIRADTGALQHTQRRGRTRLIPAHVVAAFGRVDSLPVRLGVHGRSLWSQ